MLALSFQAGEQRFALPCRDVVEVVPMLRLRAVPHAPPFVPGLFDYRGTPTPVIDLSVLIAGRPSADLLSTRVMILRVNGRSVGVLAERVTEAIDVDERRVGPSGVRIPQAPFLGGVLMAGDGSGKMTQMIVVERLLTEGVRALIEGVE